MVMPKMIQASKHLMDVVVPMNSPRVAFGTRPVISACSWAPAEWFYPPQIVLVQDTFEYTVLEGRQNKKLERLFMEVWPLGAMSVSQDDVRQEDGQHSWTTTSAISIELVHWLRIQRAAPIPGLGGVSDQELVDALGDRIIAALIPATALAVTQAAPLPARNSAFAEVARGTFEWEDDIPTIDVARGRVLNRFYFAAPSRK